MNSIKIRINLVAMLLMVSAAEGAAQNASLDYDKLQAETAQRLSEYLRINTSNPPGNELATARWLKEVLDREGIEGHILDTAELAHGRANFYARLKGRGSGKAIAPVHHMDVVPVTGEPWAVVPFAGVRWYGMNVGEKRVYWQKLVVKGKASHGSRPTADNPVPRLARILTRIAAWEAPLRVTPAVDRYFKAQSKAESGERRRWLANLAAAVRSPRGRAWLLGDPERNALLRNTISPTVLVGSNKTNTIPPEASAELDIRLLPDQDTLAFRRELLRVIADTGVTFSSKGHMAPAFSAPLDSDMARAIERTSARLVPGAPFATTISTGAIDRPYYAGAGIICYGVDPFLVDIEDVRRGVHGTDERVSLENLGFGLKLYVGILQELQNPSSR